jgi:lia operon protein LiaG
MPVIAQPRSSWLSLLLMGISAQIMGISAQTGSALAAQQQEQYTVRGDEVAIYNLAGEVRVEPGPGPAVTAQVTRGGADAAKLKVLRSEVDGTESLRLIYPSDRIVYSKMSDGSSTQLRVRDDGTFSDNDHGDEDHKRNEGRRITIMGRGEGLNAYADLKVTIPRGKRVGIYLAVGKVTAANVEGDLTIDAASAPVNSTNSRGDLEIDVGSGAVQVSQARGELSIDTGSGEVAISDIRGESISIETGSGQVTGSDVRSNQLSINTGSGDIQVSSLNAPQVNLETGSGAVTADMSGELWNLSVETGSGDVTLKAPPTLGAEVDIETSSGDIETDFEVSVTRHARDHMTGRIGDGRGKIDIETGSGGIKLVKNVAAK